MCFLNNRTNFVERDKLLTGYSWVHQVLKKIFPKAILYINIYITVVHFITCSKKENEKKKGPNEPKAGM